jgi:SAM-dependent methyltransferase
MSGPVSDQVPWLYGNRERAGSFGEDAEQYDRVRPAYPPALVDALVAEAPHQVLDVGCGTGIAARLVTQRGCQVLGLEPDPRMADVARRHGLQVEKGIIESWDPKERRFDLLTAGQSWHWVDPVLGAAKAGQVLRPGGRIGLFWNQAQPESGIAAVFDEVYGRHAPALSRQTVLLGRRPALLYDKMAEVLTDSGKFESVTVERFGHEATYTTDHWIELASTHSDHRTLPPDQLAALLGGLRAGIDGHGGEVAVSYETTLVTGLTIERTPMGE